MLLFYSIVTAPYEVHDILSPAMVIEDSIHHCEHNHDVGLNKKIYIHIYQSKNKTKKTKRAVSQTEQNAGKKDPLLDAISP